MSPLDFAGHCAQARLALSAPQQEVWLQQLRFPDSACWNLGGTMTLDGPLDVPRFLQALRLLVAHTDSLRQRLYPQGAECLQGFVEDSAYDCPYEDLAGRDDAEAEVRRRVEAAAREPFALEGRLFQFGLYRVSAHRHLWLLKFHHICADGLSVGLLVRRQGQLYGELGGVPEAGALGSLEQVLVRQQAGASPPLARSIEAWQDMLADASGPFLHPRGDGDCTLLAGRRSSFTLAVPEVAALAALGKDLGASSAQVLLALFSLLLGRRYGVSRPSVGYTTQGRVGAAEHATVGMFVATVPVALALSDDMSLAELIGLARMGLRRAYRHRRLSSADIARDTQAADGLFDVALSVERLDYGQSFTGLRSQAEAFYAGEQLLPLVVQVRDHHAGTAIRVEYEHQLRYFAEGEIARLHRQFCALLLRAAQAPQSALALLMRVSTDEQCQLDEWGQGGCLPMVSASLTATFRQAARRTPDAVAVEAGDRALDYAQLDRLSDAVAGQLRRQGVKPGERVGLYAVRGCRLIIGLLGILKARAAYVPLDPEHPLERVQGIVAQAGCVQVLSDGLDYPGRCLDIQQACNGVGEQPLPEACAQDLAYLIFTSGSTGDPKGVMIEHGSVLQLVQGLQQEIYARYPGPQRVALVASVGFDASVQQIFAALGGGHTLVLVDDASRRDAECLARFYQERRIGLSDGTPALLGLLAATAMVAPPRHLLIGGEALPWTVLLDYLGRHGGAVTNLYGPTECCVDVTALTLQVGARGTGTVALGKPMPGRFASIRDPSGALLPIGALGELWIAAGEHGFGLASGYVGRPDLTEARFVLADGRRWYRSGDLCWWDEAGQIRYLRRNDDQVKVRGYRIELEEVAQAVRRLEGITGAAVTLVHSEGVAELAAFVTGTVDPAALRRELRGRLPSYMVPTHVVPLARLPLNRSGKVDRPALQLPLARGGQGADRGPAPRGEAQLRLAAAWESTLGQSGISAHDDFFLLGGHSLHIVALLGTLRREGLELRFADVFETPVLADLATRLVRRQASVPPLVAVAVADDYPATAAQRRFWLLAQAGVAPAYTAGAAWRFSGTLNGRALQQAVGWLLQRHPALRSGLLDGPQGLRQRPLQVDADWAVVALPQASGLLPRLRDDAAEPFDLANGRLLRARLYWWGDGEYAFALLLHHSAVDAQALDCLVRDLTVAYTAFGQGAAPRLPPPALSPADLGAWEQNLDHRHDAAYWRARLAAVRPCELPLDRPRPRPRRHAAASVQLALPRTLRDAVHDRARVHNGGLFAALIASLQMLLQRASGAECVTLGTVVSLRDDPRLADTVAFLANTLCLVASPDPRGSLAEALAQSVEDLALALDHRHLPFDAVVAECGVAREAGRQPLFDVLLVLAEGPAAVPGFAGVQVQPLPLEAAFAKADLLLTAVDGAETLELSLSYATDIFDRATARDLLEGLVIVLETLAQAPATLLAAVLLPLRLVPRSLAAVPARSGVVPELRPSTPLAPQVARVAAIWAEVLMVPVPGGQANFFDLGGHSLSAMKVINRLREQGWAVELADLFAAADLDDFARRLQHRRTSLRLPPLRATAPQAYAASAAQRRIWVLAQTAGQDAAYVIGGAYRLSGPLQLAALEAAVQALAQRHDALRSRFFLEGATLQVRVDPHAEADWALLPWSGESSLTAAFAVPFDLACDPLLRVRLFRLDEQQHVLVLCLHHIAADGWSVRVLLDDLGEHYRAACHQTAAALAPAGLSAGDAALWQIELAESEQLAASRAYWSNRLALIRAPELPSQYPRPAQRQHSAGRLTATLEPAVRQGLERLAREHGCGLFAVLLALTWAWQQRLTGASPVLVGSPVSLRDDVRLESVVAFCANTLCLSGRVLDEDDVRTLVDQAARTLTLALRHRHYPFDALVDQLGDRRQADRGPLFDLFLALEEGEATAPCLDGLEVEVLPVAAVASKFDLMLTARIGDSGLVFELEYARDLYGPQTAGLLFETLLSLAEAFAGDATRPLRELPRINLAAAGLRLWPQEQEQVDGDEVASASDPQVQQALIVAWSQVLGQPVKTKDDFFDLGGHSLKALGMIELLRREHGLQLSLNDLFRFPRLDRLAAALGKRQSEALPRLAPAASWPACETQRQYALLDARMPGVFNRPSAFILDGELDNAALERALAVLLGRHEVLRSLVLSEQGELRQRVLAVPTALLQHLDLSVQLSPHGALTGELERLARWPIGLDELPLRAVLVRLAERHHCLLLVVHHVASDGVSMGILGEELSQAYAAFQAGHTPSLAPLLWQYRDAAAWFDQQAAGSLGLQARGYWHGLLSARKQPQPELPLDLFRSGEPALAGWLDWTLPTALSVALLGQPAGAGLLSLLASGLAQWLHALIGEDTVIGTILAGRADARTTRLVGSFATPVPLYFAARQGVAAAQAALQGAHLHQAYPFTRLLADFAPVRQAGRMPLFDVLLVLHEDNPALRLEGLVVTALTLRRPPSGYDLVFEFSRAGQELSLRLEYNAALIFEDTAQSWAQAVLQQLQRLVDARVE
ncbi:MAG: amino acid adenylation domain-containing protein [Pseudomonas sp.]|uniref:amino acid adenylation domain-containing protein n=1 Tax=Pseudomonas sp. TaxID=306 RepID=UPI0033928322